MTGCVRRVWKLSPRACHAPEYAASTRHAPVGIDRKPAEERLWRSHQQMEGAHNVWIFLESLTAPAPRENASCANANGRTAEQAAWIALNVLPKQMHRERMQLVCRVRGQNIGDGDVAAARPCRPGLPATASSAVATAHPSSTSCFLYAATRSAVQSGWKSMLRSPNSDMLAAASSSI